MLKSVPLAASALMLALGAGSAAARDFIDIDSVPIGRAAIRAVAACAPDIQRLCADTPRGGGRLVACLAEQREALSAPCAEEADKADLLIDAAIACAADAEQFCAGVPIGGGRIVSCLAGNQDRISDACYGAMAAGVEAYGGVVE